MRRDTVLNSGWRLAQLRSSASLDVDGEWMSVEMPTGVHEVLLREGKIPDPYFSTNASKATWVGESDWLFATQFEAPAPQAGQRIRLLFDGIDTLGEVFVNGTSILSTDNMFREYAADVTDLIRAGQPNRLEVKINSPVRYLNQVELPVGFKGATPVWKALRKSSGDHGPYLGARPNFMKVGIYRPVRLSVTDASWIEHLRVRASVVDGAGVVRLDLEHGGDSAVMMRWTVEGPDGALVAHSEAAAGEGAEITISDPQLWWPWTHGAQPLYLATAELVDETGLVLDRKSATFAFRTIEFMPSTPETKRFGFTINGKPIFMRGANWVPLTGITHVWDEERAQANLDLAQQANMNTLRVWGGGVVSEDSFYDECDRRGILVWQDFMFEYGLYPTRAWSKAFDETVAEEVAGIVKRLRNHPSIFLWCGGNEVEMSWDFQHGGHPGRGFDLFEETMAPICAEHDGTRPYHVNSPIGGPVPNWALEGDWHDYDFNTFSTGTSVPLFTSESGRASTPTFSSMQRFLPPEELWPEGHDARIARPGQPAWPEAWSYHAPDNTWDEIAPIDQLIEPTNAWELVRSVGLAHGEYLRDRYERSRRGTPDGLPPGERQSWGVISWRLNDPWPVVQFSVVDSYLQPKIAYYYLKRSFEPVLVSFERTIGALGVWVTNDSADSVTGRLVVRRQRFDGSIVKEHAEDVTVGPAGSVRVFDASTLGPISLHSEYVSATFGSTERIWLPSSERYLHLAEGKLSCRLDGQTIVIEADTLLRQIVVEGRDLFDVVADENWFDLPARTSKTVRLRGSGKGEITISALNAAPVTLSVRF